jgi:hypothetical protein
LLKINTAINLKPKIMKTNLLKIVTVIFLMVSLQAKSQAGAALNFDGINDQVKFGGFGTMGAFSIQFWMRTTQTGPTGTQWYQGNGIVDAEVSGAVNDYGVSLLGSKVAFGTGNPDVTITSTTNVNDGNWHQITAMYTSNPNGVMWLYVDGILEGYQDPGVSSNARNTNVNLCVGSIQTNIQYFNGDVDEVRLWNKVLGTCERNSHLMCELGATLPGLLRHFSFNQGIAAGTNTAITTATNITGSNNANILNMSLTGATSNFISSGGVAFGNVCGFPDAQAQGNGSNINNGATGTSTANLTSFSPFCPNSQAKTHIYTIQNNGNGPLNIGTPTITGANAALFQLTALPPSSIAALSGATFAITFTASAPGAKNATLSFTTNQCSIPNYNYALAATVSGTAPIISVNSGSICSGNSFVISPSGATNYTFSGGSATVSPFTSANYTVIGSNTGSCTSPASAISNVTVIALPVITVASGSICTGSSFTLSPSGASSYTFSSGSAIVTPTANETFTISGEDQGCYALDAVADVTVNALPTISISNGTICTGQSFTLSPSGASSYTFSSGGAVVTPTANETFTITGDAFGCNALPVTANVSVNALPIISVANGTICAGNSFTLNPTGALTYSFSSGSAVVNPTTTSSYSIIGTDSLGCQSAGAAISNVMVNQNPIVNATSNSSFICAGQSANLTANGANSYVWSNASTTSSITIAPSTTTSYTVTGTGNNGCVGTAIVSQSVSLCTAIGTFMSSEVEISLLKIYPNPSNGHFTIFISEKMIVKIFDLTGKLVHFQKLNEGANGIQLQNISQGIYILKADNGYKIQHEKIVVE